MFNLVSKYKPTGDQPEAIKELVDGINKGQKSQVLMGVTGSGKTFTMANVIASVNKPTLVLAHNKTLAGIISIISPFTLNVPLDKSYILLSYNISTSFFKTSSLSMVCPFVNVNILFL